MQQAAGPGQFQCGRLFLAENQKNLSVTFAGAAGFYRGILFIGAGCGSSSKAGGCFGADGVQ